VFFSIFHSIRLSHIEHATGVAREWSVGNMSRSVKRSVKHGDARQRGDDSHEDERDQHELEPSEHRRKYSFMRVCLL
jgi:hypothetical protein